MITNFIILIFNIFIFKNYTYISKKYNIYDYPDNIRKKHTSPTPLIGGLVIYLNLVLYYFLYLNFDLNEGDLFASKYEMTVFFLTASSFFFLGLVDDKYQVKANHKLLVVSLLIVGMMYFDQKIILESIDFTFYNHDLNLKPFQYFFTVLCFLLFVNALNMLDGINGQVASNSIFIIILFVFSKIDIFFLLIPLTIFLLFNFKNKMFLGDSGTMLLGFVISYFFIKSHNSLNSFTSDEIFLIMMIPGFELLRLALTRIINHKHPFKPDNNHIHHYMLKKYSFKKTYLLIQLLLILPYLSYLLFLNSIYSFLLSIFMYTIIIRKFSKF